MSSVDGVFSDAIYASPDSLAGGLADEEETQRWLDAIPTAYSLLDRFTISYPATTFVGEESIQLQTRVPASWVAQIEEIREKVGTRLPRGTWKTISEWVRWAIGNAIADSRTLQQALDNGTDLTNPIINAQLFLERRGGQLEARANVMADAATKAAKLAEAIRRLMFQLDEKAEAADLITEWFEGAREMRNSSVFWENYFRKILIGLPDMPKVITTLIREGYIVDEEIAEMYSSLMDLVLESDSPPDLDDLPTEI